MKRKFLFLKSIGVSVLITTLTFPSFAQKVEGLQVDHIKGELINTVSDLKKTSPILLKKKKEKGPKIEKKTSIYDSPSYFGSDPALQDEYVLERKTPNARLAAATGLDIIGIVDAPSAEDEDGTNVPDPTVAVGPNHILQMTNGVGGSHFKIWNKSGTVALSERNFEVVSGRPGYCDPIALYDQAADRFFMSEMVSASQNGGVQGIAIAVSMTNNPTGGWYTYYFPFGESIDYPKFSVWNDAYYGTLNHQGTDGSWSVSGLYAFNKAQMLAGAASPTLLSVKLPQSLKSFSACPVLWQGATLPPIGTGGLFAVMADDAWTSNTADRDSIGIYEFDVNFTTPSLSTVTQIASLATLSYKSNICDDLVTGYCINQVNEEYPYLQATQHRVMNQPIYRNFGTHQGIVMTHIVDRGSNVSGIRWYELRKTTGNWSILQQSTYSPDTKHRWLPSMAYDAYGSIGLGYNVSSATELTSIRYTGRKSCDPLNTMTFPEAVIQTSTEVHYADNSKRYGDYNHMVADPDGNSVWFTSEYDDVNYPLANWNTKITNITLDNCTTVSCSSSYEPNNSRSAAVAFPINSTISSAIQTSSDNDYFKFSNSSSAKNIKVTLSNLPADYDLELYRNGSSSVLKSAKHSGLGNEAFYYNTSTIAQYEVRVFPRSGGSSALCYNLKVELSNTNYSSAREEEENEKGEEDWLEAKGIYAYPVPADETVSVSFQVNNAGIATLLLLNVEGEVVLQQKLNTKEGKNLDRIDVKRIPEGVYMLKVEQEGVQRTAKVVLTH